MGKLVKQEVVRQKIFVIRGHKVMLSFHLAELYEVETKVLLQAVKRNMKRFPPDFMFLLTEQEVKILRSQFVTSRWGGMRYLPYAFTELGIAMLSSVLKSERVERDVPKGDTLDSRLRGNDTLLKPVFRYVIAI